MQPPKQKEKKAKDNNIDNIDFNLLLTSQSRDEQKKIVTEQLKPIGFKNKQQLQAKFKQQTKKRYLIEGKNYPCDKNLEYLINDVEKINSLLKQCQVNSPIVDSLNDVFIDYLVRAQTHKSIQNQELIKLWQFVPFRNLQSFLSKLNLEQYYKAQDIEKFTKNLIGLVGDNKLQQCCLYYALYSPIAQFEDKVLVPKLITSDQIYNPVIIEMLKKLPELKHKVVEQIDPAKAVIILQHLEEDPRNYPMVMQFILRKHYKSMTHQYSAWQIFEDKMSFNTTFIEWYCTQQNLPEQVKESIRFRNAIGGQVQHVANPLFKYDEFKPTQQILAQHGIVEKVGKHKQVEANYVHLGDYGISEKDIYFINNSDSRQFDEMVKDLQTRQFVGFDAEYRCTSTKYEQLGVALIQISTGNQIYLIDFINLQSDQKFIKLFAHLLSNPQFVLVGHSVQSDIKFIQRTMKVQALQGVADIAKIFKQKFPNQTQNSLAFMTKFLTGKQLSKYQQRSNWNRRPLKKSQKHYAALDAEMCLILFELLKQKQITLTQAIAKNKKKSSINMIRKQNIVYQQTQQHLLKRQKPKFLIDSMLKRLCSMLRNLGIDAQYMAVSNYQLMQQIAGKQERVILTRDKKLLSKKAPNMPIYCIVQKGDSDLMLQEVKKQFNIDFSKFTTLSRCVKCNCSDLEIIDKQEAMKYINFEHQNNQIEEFWRCLKCKQIYWEGNQFKNAKKRFQNI